MGLLPEPLAVGGKDMADIAAGLSLPVGFSRPAGDDTFVGLERKFRTSKPRIPSSIRVFKSELTE